MGGEIALPLHLPSPTSYADLEEALVAAGFEHYTIMRNVNPDDTVDAQLYVRGGFDPSGNQIQLVAGDTMARLSDAVNALEASFTEGDTPAEPA